MHHRRGKPKSARAGYLLCKPHKRQGFCLHERLKVSHRVRAQATAEEVRRYMCEG